MISTVSPTDTNQLTNRARAAGGHSPSRLAETKLPDNKEIFSMIVVMQKGATQDQVDHMVERVEALGLKSHVIVGTERTVIAAIG